MTLHPTMTVVKAHEMRIVAEHQIAAIIRNYQEVTGLPVTDLKVDYVQSIEVSNRSFCSVELVVAL